MSATLAGIYVPPVSPSLPPFRERLQVVHTESVAAGPTGPLILFLACLSSASLLLAQGIRHLYRRCRGYA